MSKDLYILISILILGLFYLIYSIKLENIAFFIKIFLLIISFILAFTDKEYIVVGPLAFGGRTSVMLIILIEIIDTIIEKKLIKKG